MEFAHFNEGKKRPRADALVLPFWKEKHSVKSAAYFSFCRGCLVGSGH